MGNSQHRDDGYTAGQFAHRRHRAVVQVLVSKQDGVFDEDGTGSQDEGREQVDVDVVSGAAELSGKWKRGQGRKETLL